MISPMIAQYPSEALECPESVSQNIYSRLFRTILPFDPIRTPKNPQNAICRPIVEAQNTPKSPLLGYFSDPLTLRRGEEEDQRSDPALSPFHLSPLAEGDMSLTFHE
jgi:hypothetical protein